MSISIVHVFGITHLELSLVNGTMALWVIWVSSCTVQCIHKTLYILLGSYKNGDEKVDSYNITTYYPLLANSF
jgi:hypothetical protein